jgi:4-hydroxybenzoate polyprenyltransferase
MCIFVRFVAAVCACAGWDPPLLVCYFFYSLAILFNDVVEDGACVPGALGLYKFSDLWYGHASKDG